MDVEETEVPAPDVTADFSSAVNSSSLENTTTATFASNLKRSITNSCSSNAVSRSCVTTGDEEQGLQTSAKKVKRQRTSANNSFRYWQVKVEDSGDSSILDALNTNVKISRVLPISPTSIGLQFVKSMTSQQVRAIFKDYQCGEISRMECSTFRQLDRSINGKKKPVMDESSTSNESSRLRIYPTNSYYTFTTAGKTFAERVANVKKILNMSPVKKSFSSGDDTREHPESIRDIHFFKTDLAKGCFAVMNKAKTVEPKEEGEHPSLAVKEFDLAKYYEGLVTDIENIDHDEYRVLIHHRNMRRHIKSWICICPYSAEDGVPPANDAVAKKGIFSYRLFDNDTGVFQFTRQRSAITPVEAAKAMGAMHKSLCFQSSGKVVQNLLEDNNSNNIMTVASMGDLIYRSKWRSNDKRPTKFVKFYSVADDKKITDQDILDIVNTEKMFHNIHFREDRAYGVARKSGNEKIVPNDIKLPDVDSKIRFTAITFTEFNNEKNAEGMNCFSTWRKGPKANTFGNIVSTAFSFDGLTKEAVEGILSQKRVKFIKAVKNKDVEDSYRGVVKTATGVKGCNLASKNNGKVIPEGKKSFGHKLEALKNEILAIDFSREEAKAITGDKEEEQRIDNVADAENPEKKKKEEEEEEDDEEEEE